MRTRHERKSTSSLVCLPKLLEVEGMTACKQAKIKRFPFPEFIVKFLFMDVFWIKDQANRFSI